LPSLFVGGQLMHFVLEETRLLLGCETDTDKALALDKLPLNTFFSNLSDGSEVVSAFCHLPDNAQRFADCNKLERVEQLLLHLLTDILPGSEGGEAAICSQMPVFWLLPELSRELVPQPTGIIDTGLDLTSWAARLKKTFPALFSHKLSQFFPFGRAALPMALATLAELFYDNPAVPGVYFIAVDSLYQDLNNPAQYKQWISATSDSGLVPSEGGIFTCIRPAKAAGEAGITIDFSAQESSSNPQRSQGIASLFLKACQFICAQERKVSNLYLPGNGCEDLSKSWLDAYFQLAPCLGAPPEIMQSALFTGELGSVTGLYNLLHIYSGFEQQELTGYVMQLEQSHSLYQGLALYSWQEERLA